MSRHLLQQLALRAVIAAGLFLAALHVCPAASINADFTPVTGYMEAPQIGQADFCQRYPAECAGDLDVRLELTADQLAAVARINHAVNHEIIQRTDPDHWGLPERWDFAEDGSGDCEDFAFLKRRRLMALGFPRGAMPLTVARMPDGRLHAVLTLQTVYGDFILDVNTDRVLPWQHTDLTFISREDTEHPGLWLKLDGRGDGQGRAP